MIRVEGLTKRYGDVLALDDVSFTVEAGEIVGFLGPNGAGKSTAMKIITGSLAPTAGAAVVADHDLLDDALAVRRRVGFMPEQVALYPDETVASVLDFVAELKGVPAARRVEHLGRIVESTGLVGVRRKLVGALSHGYRKRLGLAQALIGDPDVLVLDEPTSGLDPHQIVEFRELVRGFGGERSVLLSSHILSEISAVCGRVLILKEGRLVAEESAAGLAGDGDRVILSWDGDWEAVATALRTVAGVDSVTITDAGAEVSIAGNPVEVRPRLVESVLAAGGRLQNIQDRGPSLEDLFLRLTGVEADLQVPADTDSPAAADPPARPEERS
ncbi:MAG: ABC transporter ATP-binding protein [bacterium]|nr:ABC transporter ATP-binding protein [bacterium]